MRAVGSVLRELRDSQDKRIDGIHAELIARLDGLIGRAEKNAQRVSALHGRVVALERKLAKD
ncbi:MAG: hypothetical protein WKH97_02345 [Casimicrobiaceae bacterium]